LKYLLVIGDGMADNPVPQLGNRTPLQTAHIPAIDRMAARGLTGRVVNCPAPLPAEMTRRHNDANVLAMGAQIIGGNLAERILDVFLSTEFEGGRHQRREDKIMETEQ